MEALRPGEFDPCGDMVRRSISSFRTCIDNVAHRNECDLTGQGALGIEGFVKGMWRIDEELRRAQTQALKSAKSLSSLSSAYRSSGRKASVPKLPPRPKSRDILR